MELDDILPGCKVDIIKPKLGANGKPVGIKAAYKSSLYSVIDENHIEVMSPFKGTIVIPLEREDEYSLVFTTAQGLLRAKGIVVDRYKRENFYLTEFEVPGEISKYQRREFFRIDCMIPVSFEVLTDKVSGYDSISDAKNDIKLRESQGEEILSGTGTIIDISGGGIKVTTQYNIQDMNFVLFRFELIMKSGTRVMEIIGRTVHSDHIPDTDKYSHRIQFMYTDEVSQEVLIRYIFEIERSRRRKEQGL